jgi:hypothetical protein
MVENFIKIFEGYNSAHGTFTRDKSKLPGKAEGKSLVYREELTKSMWENHLNGIEPSLGIMPVNENSEAQWGCIDVDDFNLDYEGILQNIRKLNLPLIMVRSKSGCAHIFLFIKKFIPAEEIKFVMNVFAAQLGIADKMDRIYPMQTEFLQGGTGSWLNMPYFNLDEGGRYAYKDDMESASIEEFFEMYNTYVQEDLDKYLQAEPQQKLKPKEKKIKKPCELPCIKNCKAANNGKIPKGSRNEFLFHQGVYYNKAHEDISKAEGIIKTPETLLREFNSNSMVEPLDEKEILIVSQSLKKNEYKYKCKVPQIKKYCDVSKCKTNPAGITPDEAKELITAHDILGSIHEYGSVPPKFFMYVQVKKTSDTLKPVRVEFTGSELKNKMLFMKKLHDWGHFPPKVLDQMKPNDFADFIDGLLERRGFEVASEEANIDFDFKVLMRDFLEKTTVSLDKADMLDGACFYDRKKQVMHFKLNKLQQYLQAARQPMHSRELTFKITKILNGKKNNGKVFDRLGQEKSCPTWEYPEDRENFVITLNGQEAMEEIENEKN